MTVLPLTTAIKTKITRTDKLHNKQTVLDTVEDFPALLKETVPYNFEEYDPKDTAQLMKDMTESLMYYNGYGISANQLGLPHRIFAIHGEPWVIFNPRIAMMGDEQVKLDEACLSFPGMTIPIRRSKHIRVRYADPNGEINSHTYTGMTARIFLHEMAHLDGKMWFQNCSRFHLERAMRQAKQKGNDYYHLGLLHYAKEN
jgi:peptide deformylase